MTLALGPFPLKDQDLNCESYTRKIYDILEVIYFNEVINLNLFIFVDIIIDVNRRK